MDELKDLVARLQKAFGHELESVILYGSGAGGDHHRKFSDLNILCVLKQITPHELSAGEPVLKWWRDRGHPSPLLMTEEEAHNSADSFPIEFRDMQDRRQVLFGSDVIAGVKVDLRYYRVHIEHELRAGVFRLRQKGAQLLSDPAGLLRLCADSISTFCVLGRHALIAAGIETRPGKRNVVRQLSETLGADFSAFATLLDVREVKAGLDPGDPGELFARYLGEIRLLVEYVDGLEEHQGGL